MLPTSLFILHVELADGGSSRKNLIPSYWVGSLDRLPTDVHACNPIRIRLESATDAPEVSPIPTVLAADASASWAGLTRVLGWNLNQRYSELQGFVAERMPEEAVGYTIRLSSTLTAHLPPPSAESVEAFDGDACIVRSGEVGQLFSEEPSVCANVASLSSTEPLEFESCFASMSVLVSVFLQFGAAVFVSDLSQRDRSSKVELLQNPASCCVHHGDSNTIGVLVYADHILRDSWRWRTLPEQHEETAATGHQDACGSPTMTDMFQQSLVGSISLDRQPETFMVSAHAEDGVSASCTSPREEAFIESYCRPLNLVCDLASLPSVPLCFLDQLACYLCAPILCVDHMMQCGVCAWLGDLHRLKCGGCGLLEGCIGFMELSLFNIGQRLKVELQYLLRRYLPTRKMFSQQFNAESCVKVPRNSSPESIRRFPCGVFYEPA